MDNHHFNNLSPRAAELLALLSEECGEVIQVIGKILRHGIESRNPDAPDDGFNRQLLEKECGDVRCAIQLLCNAGIIKEATVSLAASIKSEKVKKYLHHG